MAQWWSWALTGMGVTALYLAGRRSPWGWAVGIGAQVLWLAYSVTTRQWGFLASCVPYSLVYIKNFLSWRSADRVAAAAAKREDRSCTGS